MAAASPRRRISIFVSPSKSLPSCVSRWRKSSRRKAAAGARAASCCNICPPAALAARDLPPGDAPSGGLGQDAPEEADAWTEGLALAATLEDHELVDPSLSAERLLFRLFHERGVTVFAERELKAFCRCSDARVENLLRSFSHEERGAMIGDDGRIGVTCEFCGALRSYDPNVRLERLESRAAREDSNARLRPAR